jgi:hypothetical protein
MIHVISATFAGVAVLRLLRSGPLCRRGGSDGCVALRVAPYLPEQDLYATNCLGELRSDTENPRMVHKSTTDSREGFASPS